MRISSLRTVLVMGGLTFTACFDYGGGGNGGSGGGTAPDGGGSTPSFTHVGVVAGMENGQALSGVVRLQISDAGVSGTISTGGAPLAVSSTGPSMPYFGGIAFVVSTPSGLQGQIAIGTPDASVPVEVFNGNLTGADGGYRCVVSGQRVSNENARFFCGQFSGAASGAWNFIVVGNALRGAYSGRDGTLNVAGNLVGTVSGSSITLTWSEVFAGGTASGTISGTRISGSWSGYRDGGVWTSQESCPGQ